MIILCFLLIDFKNIPKSMRNILCLFNNSVVKVKLIACHYNVILGVW